MARTSSRSRTRTPAAGAARWTPQTAPAFTDLIDRRFGLPWFATAGVFAAACAAHLLWRDTAVVVWVAIALTLGTCALTQLAWHQAAKRRLPVRINIAVNTFAGFGWLTVATVTGPWNRPTIDVFLIAGGFLALTWNLRQAATKDGDSEDDGDVLGRLFNRNAGVVGLAGAKAKTKELTEVGAKLQVQLPAGEVTQRDVLAKTELIASLLGTAPNGVRITPDVDDSRIVELAVQGHDPLKDATPWPGPMSARKSIADAPIVAGCYLDGHDVEVNLYTPQGMRHLLIQGMNGSGKSVFGRILLADLFTRSDVVVWAIDVVKGRQTLGAAEPGIDWFATTATQAEAMFDALLKAIPARGDYLAGLPEPLDNWQPGCGIPVLAVLIEEAPAVINDKRFIHAAQRARSVGIVLVPSVQRASWTSMPTDARAQFANAICFGVQDVEDARFVIEDLVDRGADPSQWKQDKPGYAYLGAAGIPMDRQVMPLRSYLIERGEVGEMAAYRAANPVPLDEVTAAAGNRQYQARRLSVVQEDEHDDSIDEDDATMKRPAEHEPDIDGSLDPQPGDDVGTVVAFTLPEPKTSTADARAHLRKTIAQWAAASREFSPRDFYDAAAEVGRGDAWVRREFESLQDEGFIRRLDRGVYRAAEAALA